MGYVSSIRSSLLHPSIYCIGAITVLDDDVLFFLSMNEGFWGIVGDFNIPTVICYGWCWWSSLVLIGDSVLFSLLSFLASTFSVGSVIILNGKVLVCFRSDVRFSTLLLFHGAEVSSSCTCFFPPDLSWWLSLEASVDAHFSFWCVFFYWYRHLLSLLCWWKVVYYLVLLIDCRCVVVNRWVQVLCCIHLYWLGCY